MTTYVNGCKSIIAINNKVVHPLFSSYRQTQKCDKYTKYFCGILKRNNIVTVRSKVNFLCIRPGFI